VRIGAIIRDRNGSSKAVTLRCWGEFNKFSARDGRRIRHRRIMDEACRWQERRPWHDPAGDLRGNRGSGSLLRLNPGATVLLECRDDWVAESNAHYVV
jgi:hypothetical protein